MGWQKKSLRKKRGEQGEKSLDNTLKDYAEEALRKRLVG